MESVYHIVTICVNETSWAHVWRLRSLYLRTGYDTYHRVWIEEKQSQKKLSSSRFKFLFSQKTLPSNLSWLQRAFSRSATRKERLSGDESSLTLESESEMCRDDLPMRQRSVKSPVLRLGLSSSSELEESLLEKSRSLRACPTTSADPDLRTRPWL
jgi:hypothetical protein